MVQSRSIIFSRDGKQYVRAGLIDGESLFPDSFPEENNKYHELYTSVSSGVEKVQLETRPADTDTEQFILKQIHNIFSEEYAKLFDPFNYNKLNEIYMDKGRPNILKGTVVEDATKGKETVKYEWLTKKQWLDNLKFKSENKLEKFKIKTALMGIFHDRNNKDRYWAIVNQKWQSLDPVGHLTYSDNGFLLVNFDFNHEKQLESFKIHYRLWFYDYKYDDIERGIKRYQKLEMDIKSYFEDSIGGIDSTLKQVMREFIVQKVKSQGARRFRAE